MDDRPLFEKPLGDLVPETAKRSAPRAEAPLTNLDTSADALLAIGRGQRRLILWVLIGILYRLACLAVIFALGGPAIDTPVGVALVAVTVGGGLAIDIVGLVVFVRFVGRLYPTLVSIVLVLLLLGCLGLLVVLVVNVRATRILTRNGIRVGLLGARSADLDRLDVPRPLKGRDAKLPKLGW